VTSTVLVQGGKRLRRTDRLGGIFAPLPGLRPAYSYGPKDSKMREVLFQCPVSAIPAVVWDLLMLWWNCRHAGPAGSLPLAGGFLDQPASVQHAFPILEAIYRGIERAEQRFGPERAAALAIGAVFGKGR
jgi:hypothetical protein